MLDVHNITIVKQSLDAKTTVVRAALLNEYARTHGWSSETQVQLLLAYLNAVENESYGELLEDYLAEIANAQEKMTADLAKSQQKVETEPTHVIEVEVAAVDDPRQIPDFHKRAVLHILSRESWDAVEYLLNSDTIPSIPLGDVVGTITHVFDKELTVRFDLVNGEIGVYVEPHMFNPKKPDVDIDALPPRRELCGVYEFMNYKKKYVVNIVAPTAKYLVGKQKV